MNIEAHRNHYVRTYYGADAWEAVADCLARAFEGDHKRAFYEAGLAREDYLRADQCMRRRTAVLCCF